MKRATLALILAVVVGWGLAVTDGHALGAAQGQAKGKGGGGGGSEPNWVLEVTINDLLDGARLLSDLKQRTDPDGDLDDFLDLAPVGPGAVLYRDHRLDAVTTPYTDPDRDPCTQFELSTDSSPGRTRMDFSRRSSEEFQPNIRCDLDPRYHDDDERTFMLVFDKSEGSVAGNEGGACACDKLGYVVGIAGARTTFVDSNPGDPAAGTCTLGIAPGEIAPEGEGENTGARITAWPFEDLIDGKRAEKKSGQTADGSTSVTIRFRTDVEDPSETMLWHLSSQGETVPVAEIDADTRSVTAGGQSFDLSLNGDAQCSNIGMTFELTVKRIDLNAGS